MSCPDGEDFFAWLDRMHELPPTVHAGEVYVHGGDAVEVLHVGDDTVRWRACVPNGREQQSYRATFEEWAATATLSVLRSNRCPRCRSAPLRRGRTTALCEGFRGVTGGGCAHVVGNPCAQCDHLFHINPPPVGG